MSGHSKFANIKHKKEKNDAAKGKVFTMLGREIQVAVKAGGPDPAVNGKLRDVIAKCKSNNMPNDTIERSIKKAAGNEEGVEYELVTYEGYGPSGVAVIVEALTDNRNRAAANVRNAFTKGGGNMGTNGCVSFMFDQKGLIVIDKYTMILSANSSAWNLFRVDKVCQGESVYCLDRAEDFRHAIEQVLSGEHAELILKLNGSDIQLIANPVVRGQKTEGAVILLVNVTEKLERENLRREFSANVSHELKTPLTSISGFAEIMQGGLVKCEDIPKFAGRIYKESQRLLQLVEDVIQISQLDEEKTSYTWELVDVYQVCKNAFESLKEKAQSMNVHLYICGDSMKMEAVRTLLEEAVYNVCDNAIKYNRNDGSVSIFLTQTAHEIQIVVKDTGVGIPKEDQDRVFERFYRVDKSHSKEIGGTGLGLSIVKHAVSTLNGSIVLRSEEGSGTEITMKFLKVHKE